MQPWSGTPASVWVKWINMTQHDCLSLSIRSTVSSEST
jgi:hypothetical protein